MFRKSLLVSLVLGMLSIFAFAGLGDLFIYSSLTTAGSTAGGFRIDLGSGFVADATVGLKDDGSGNAKTLTEYFADVYYGPWGVAISGAEGSIASVYLRYAIEQPINDKIALGIAADLVTAGGGSGMATRVLNGYDIYAVIAI